MRKYILVSFTPSFDKAPVQVAVPYISDVDLQTLVYILTKNIKRTEKEEELVDRIHERQHLVTPVDLSVFTHFIQEA